VTLSKNTVVTVLPAPSTLTMSGTLNASGVTLTKNGAGNLSVKNVRSAGLVINGGGVLIGANGTSAGVSHVGTLAIADEGYLDLADNDLIVDYSGASQFNQIRNWVIEGFSGTPIGAGVSGIHSVTSQNNGGQTILALFDNAPVRVEPVEGAERADPERDRQVHLFR
jgi:hypothetical protein